MFLERYAMNNKLKTKALLAVFAYLILISISYAQQSQFRQDFLTAEMMTKERLKYLPIPADFRNYFMLQSIDDTTNIIIGDFVGAEKKVVLITDNDSNDTLDIVHEYYPETKKYATSKKPTTAFFTDMKDIKKQIVEGSIFRNNYSYKMNSLDFLKQRLERGRDIFRYEHGYAVKVYDPDKVSTIMSEYFFGKKDGRYDLIFSTKFYRIFNTRINPGLFYSVYCKNSKDPYVAEIVESLLKMVRLDNK